MAPPDSRSPRSPIKVVLSSTALLPFLSVSKAAALSIAQLGIGAFFIAGVVRASLGEAAPWFVLAAASLSALFRAVDIESWALLIPGGLVGRARQAYGPRFSGLAAAAALVERLFLAALACILIGHYASGVTVTAIAGFRFTGYVQPEDLASLIAIAAIGWLWLRARIGRVTNRDAIAQWAWVGVTVLAVLIIWGLVTLLLGRPEGAALGLPLLPSGVSWPDTALSLVLGLGLALPAVGGGEALARTAHELPQPRSFALRRTARITVAFALAITAVSGFLFVWLVPAADQNLWTGAPLAGIADHLAGPRWARDLLAALLAAGVVLVLLPAAYGALSDAEQMLQQLSVDGLLPRGLTTLNPRFGTPSRAIDATTTAVVAIMLVTSGRVPWLSRAYAIAIAAVIVIKVASLARLRGSRPEASAFLTPFNIGAGSWPAGLALAGLIAGAAALTAVATGDVPSLTVAALVGGLGLLFSAAGRDVGATTPAEDPVSFDLRPPAEISPREIDVRPGNVLVPVRNPHALAHVAAALQAAGDRDVVVMTVRLLGVDASSEASGDRTPTLSERRLLSEIVALAERSSARVRLLVVPAHNVFDALVSTIVRLRSSDVYVGESSSLTVEDQARLVGEAWERAEKPDGLDVRLVIYHRSGRADLFHLGAHPPSLSSADLDLIHRVWLEAVKAVGPHVHHHDVVRVALTKMEQQLSGPNRDEVLSAIREAARPADELAAILRARDYARLRDVMRNRHANDVAELLTALTVEDQVLVFRVLPRKDAAEVFEYLGHDEKEMLLKAMAQEDVAAILNDMAPDERTMFLEELPAQATRQLLALLTPSERAVALTLLGYPEDSVGRLMTPHYVAVREQSTVREVLDHVREHGQDSETLNVIYVADDRGVLVDDIRIRELLLAPLDKHVADLMDRRFVALKATDDQDTAVARFREYDRTALPVTDTTGTLIGIVTIDDVLDVVEAAATREIQRIGGSEALEEPYMEISFARMIQKRAGWLTALFLGEMLTATAMGAFEEEISRAVVLALFVPLIISSGGNSGSQAATLVIRALALNEVGLRDWWRVMRREVLAGLSLGLILGTIGFLRISLWSTFSDVYGPHWLLVALTVALALVGVVLWGSLTGSLMPLLLRRIGFDPAVSSTPFVATLVDVTGLIIYFSIAAVLLRGTLL
jgi:magnesium transporter